MKKTFKLAAIALASLSLMVACKNAPEAPAPVEEETPAVEAIDAAVEEEEVVEEVAEATPAPKKAEAKAETKEPATVEVISKKDGKKMRVVTDDAKVEINEEAVTVKPLKRKK